MLIKSEKNKAGVTIIDLRGKWVTFPVIDRMKAIEKSKAFNCHFSVWYHERGVTDNEILISFDINDRESDIAEFVDYLHVAMADVIGKAFCELYVSTNDMQYEEGKGSLTVILEICKELDIRYDPGSWMQPVKMFPTNNIQWNKAVELLNLFGVVHN